MPVLALVVVGGVVVVQSQAPPEETVRTDASRLAALVRPDARLDPYAAEIASAAATSTSVADSVAPPPETVAPAPAAAAAAPAPMAPSPASTAPATTAPPRTAPPQTAAPAPAPTAPPSTAAPAPAPTGAPAAPTAENGGPAGTRLLGRFTVVCYVLQGRTATGDPVSTDVIAVDPSVIPLHSRVFIEGVGWRIAKDVGGAIKGQTIDVWMPDLAECRRFGKRSLNVYLAE